MVARQLLVVLFLLLAAVGISSTWWRAPVGDSNDLSLEIKNTKQGAALSADASLERSSRAGVPSGKGAVGGDDSLISGRSRISSGSLAGTSARENEMGSRFRDGQMSTSPRDGQKSPMSTSPGDGEMRTSPRDGQMRTSPRDGQMRTPSRDDKMRTSGQMNTSPRDDQMRPSPRDDQTRTPPRDNTPSRDNQIGTSINNSPSNNQMSTSFSTRASNQPDSTNKGREIPMPGSSEVGSKNPSNGSTNNKMGGTTNQMGGTSNQMGGTSNQMGGASNNSNKYDESSGSNRGQELWKMAANTQQGHVVPFDYSVRLSAKMTASSGSNFLFP